MSGPSRDTVDSQAEANTDANEENRILRRNNVRRRSKWLYPMLLALLALFFGVIGTPVVVLVLNSESRLSIHRANNSTVTTEGMTLAAVTRESTKLPRRTAPTGPSVNIVDLTIPSRPRGTRGSSTSATRRTHRPETKRERMYGPEVHEKSAEPSVQLLTDRPVPVPNKKKSVSNLNQHEHYQKHRHRYGVESAATFTSRPTQARLQTTRKNVSVAQPALQVGLNKHSHRHFPRKRGKGLNKLSSPAHSLKDRHRWSGHKRKRTTKAATAVQSAEPSGRNDTWNTSQVTTVTRMSSETGNATTDAAGASQEETPNQTSATAGSNVLGNSSVSESLTAAVSSMPTNSTDETQSKSTGTSEVTEERMVSREQAMSVGKQSAMRTLANWAPKSEEGGKATPAVSQGNSGTVVPTDVSAKISDVSKRKYGNETRENAPGRQTDVGNATGPMVIDWLSSVRELSNVTRRTDGLDASSATTVSIKRDTESKVTVVTKATEEKAVSVEQETSVGRQNATWTSASSARKPQEESKSTRDASERKYGTTIPKEVSSKLSDNSKMKPASEMTESGPRGHADERNSTESLMIDKFSYVRELSNATRRTTGLGASNATTVSTKSDAQRGSGNVSVYSVAYGGTPYRDVGLPNGSASLEGGDAGTSPEVRTETGHQNDTGSTPDAVENNTREELLEATRKEKGVEIYLSTGKPSLSSTGEKGDTMSIAEEPQRSPNHVTSPDSNHDHSNTTSASSVPPGANADIEEKSTNATRTSPDKHFAATTDELSEDDDNETDTTSTEGVSPSGIAHSNRQAGQYNDHGDPLSDGVHNIASRPVRVSTRAHTSEPTGRNVSHSTESTATSTKGEVSSRTTTDQQKRSSGSSPTASTMMGQHVSQSSAGSAASTEIRVTDISTVMARNVSIGASQNGIRSKNSSTVQYTGFAKSEVPKERQRTPFPGLSLITKSPVPRASLINESTTGASRSTPATRDEDEDIEGEEDSRSTLPSRRSEIPAKALATKAAHDTRIVLIRDKGGSSTRATDSHVLPKITLELKMSPNKALVPATTLFLRGSTRDLESGTASHVHPETAPQREPPSAKSLSSPHPPMRGSATSIQKSTVEGISKSTDSAQRHINNGNTSLLWVLSATRKMGTDPSLRPSGSPRRRTAFPLSTDMPRRERILEVHSTTGSLAPLLATRTTKFPASAVTVTEDSDLVRMSNKDSTPRSPESHAKPVGQSVDYYEDNTTFINEHPQEKTDEPETVRRRRVHGDLDDAPEIKVDTSTPTILQTAYYDDDVSSEASKAAKPTDDDEGPMYENSPEENFDDLFYR